MKIISSKDQLAYFKDTLTENIIVDVNSDLKHRIFPRPFERLSNLKDGKGLVGVEIGVCGGEHALSLLETLKIDKLFLIDPYEMYETYVNGEGTNYGTTQLPLSDTYIQALNLLKPFEECVRWIKKLSDDAVKEIHEPLDFVYVDGNHDYDFVKNDIENYYPLLKKGGVMGGHDFYNGFAITHNGVINAVTQFSASNNIQLFVEQPDWWFYKE
jgi:hypothetical protein